jgi:hypothetical protein
MMAKAKFNPWVIPTLNTDSYLADSGRTLPPHCKVERRIVWNLLHTLERKGFKPVGVDIDEIELTKTATILDAMEAIFSVDDARVVVRKDGYSGHWILLIGGNGEDIISDWSFTNGDPDGFSAAMDAFKPETWA